MPPDWDVEADVVVVGFGAAAACAALEAAAAGCSVLVLDRFGGGGATALSGGVVYAGRQPGTRGTYERVFRYRVGRASARPSAFLGAIELRRYEGRQERTASSQAGRMNGRWRAGYRPAQAAVGLAGAGFARIAGSARFR